MYDVGVEHTVLDQDPRGGAFEGEHPQPAALVEQELAALGEAQWRCHTGRGFDNVPELSGASLTDLEGHRSHPEPDASRAGPNRSREKQRQPAPQTPRRTALGRDSIATGDLFKKDSPPTANHVARGVLGRESLTHPPA